ncbi:hypothetical protein TrVE_jg4619 [Triparma verrucosa]|uniref:Fe2OG dioxygenase domain-containing protein n=1 Tax=Triparma verrucosa TaxID=1606542 RepID=A0A9W7F1Z4_9STRA|nr:hypothetical protein TrVE_jg4619 [Triparma verrucosa]
MYGSIEELACCVIATNPELYDQKLPDPTPLQPPEADEIYTVADIYSLLPKPLISLNTFNSLLTLLKSSHCHATPTLITWSSPLSHLPTCSSYNSDSGLILYDCLSLKIKTSTRYGLLHKGDNTWQINIVPCECVHCTSPFPKIKNYRGPTSYKSVGNYHSIFDSLRLAEVLMGEYQFKEALWQHQVVEYLCLKGLEGGGGEVGEEDLRNYAGNARHGQAACLTELKQHSIARDLWISGAKKYPDNSFLIKESHRINSYAPSPPSPHPHPYTSTPLIPSLAYLCPSVLSPPLCSSIITSTESHVKKEGWTTSRHYQVPTRDVPVHSIPSVLSIFNAEVIPVLSKLISQNFSEKSVTIHDAFVVKYQVNSTGTSNRGLPLHYDQSQYSFTVSLNDDYTGGGTYIEVLKKAVDPGVGEALVFKGGELEHGGEDIGEGVRYVLVVFAYGEDGVGWGVEGVKEVGVEEEGKEGGGEEAGEGSGGGGGFSFGFDNF